MDLLLVEGSCDLARQNWKILGPKIVKVAQKSSNSAIEQLNKTYSNEDMDDFGKPNIITT